METQPQQTEQEQLPVEGPIEAESWENILPEVNRRNPKFAKSVGDMVCSRIEEDLKSSSGYRKKQKRYLELFSGKIPGRKASQKNILYVHLPLLTKAVLKFHSKLHTSFFPARGDIAALTIMKPEMRDRERAMTRCINMLMRNWVTEYVPAHDQGSLSTLIFGSAFSIWRWDSQLNRPAFEFGTCDQVIVPYAYRSARADMSDVPHYTWILRMQRHEIEAAADAGDFDASAVARMYKRPYLPNGAAPPEPHEAPVDSVTETADAILGVSPGEESESMPREIAWHFCWLLLPGEKRQRAVEIFADRDTKEVLRMVIREKADPADVKRYEADVQVYQATVQSAQAAHEARVQNHANMAAQMVQKGMLPEMVPPPPSPPDLSQIPQPDPVRKVPFSRITHYRCLPNPEGFYGYGLGLLVDGHNVTADEVMSLYTSLMRMNLMPTGVFPRDSRMQRGEQALTLGEMVETRLPPEQIDKAWKVLQFPPPDPNAFKVEERQSQAVEEITADDILIGAQGPSGQSATEADLRASNAMTPIATIATRYNQSRENEIRTLANLLSEMLPQDGFRFYNKDQAALGQAGAPPDPMEEFVVYPTDFKEDLAVIFTTDPQLASQPQRERTALRTFQSVQQTVSQAVGGMPILSPTTAILLIRSAAAELFKTMDRPEYARLIENDPLPAPPAPPMPGAPGAPNVPGAIAGSGPQDVAGDAGDGTAAV